MTESPAIYSRVKVYAPPDFGRSDATVTAARGLVIDARLDADGRVARNLVYRETLKDDPHPKVAYWSPLP